ncbi:MAG: metallophosphatase [Bacteroidales bacterium]|jgi:5'-nucleotidase|nr:metallophosphatase [Bacteroidales bacterium]
MKYLIFRVPSSAFRVLLFSHLLSPFLLFSQSSPIVLLHTNDTHSNFERYTEPGLGDVGGILQRYSFIRETRNQYPNTIVADAGDFSQGTPYFNLFKGVPEIELMNMLGYDVVALGNHEFDNGSKALTKRLKLANFKIVCANYKFKNNTLSKLVKPYAVINISGTKIGFFGLLCDMKRIVMPNYYKETTFLDPIISAQKTVELLKNREGCDIIVCLSHLGFDVEFPDDITDRILAEKVSGIDFIIGGHTHKLIEEPVIVNHTKILQAKKNGIYVGKLTITH